MSLKNYIFSSVNLKSPSSFVYGPYQSKSTPTNIKSTAIDRINEKEITMTKEEENNRFSNTNQESSSTPRSPPPDELNGNNNNNIRNNEANTNSNRWIKNIQLIWSFISVEPVMICWILPTCFLLIANENLKLEKSCRVNYGYSDEICDNMIDRTLNNISCVDVRAALSTLNITGLYIEEFENKTFFANGTEVSDEIKNLDITDLELSVCRAEIDSQTLDTQLNIYTAPFDSIFGIVIILFAGGWSDRKGKRKPCLLLPLLGEFGSLISLLIAAIFMKQLPLEFNAVLSKLLPAITGGTNLMLMGVYSYLSQMTAEEDRTFRYGIFAVFVPLIPIFSTPFAGELFESLGYVKLLLLCIPINVIGILYIIFVLKEVPPKPQNPIEITNGINGHDNPAHNVDEVNDKPAQNGNHQPIEKPTRSCWKNNCLVEFFDPTVAVDCVKVLTRIRDYNGRRILIVLLVMYLIAIGPAFGEDINEYNFTRIQLDWDGLIYSPYATYSNFISLIGTSIMIGGLSKLIKLPDAILGFLSSLSSTISRIFYASATTLTIMYIARTIDMFVSVRALTIKSLISTIVGEDELGRIFSIIGIIESLSKYVFVTVYSVVYTQTINVYPGLFFVFSFFALALVTIIFFYVHIAIKKGKAKKLEELEDKGIDNEYYQTTHM